MGGGGVGWWWWWCIKLLEHGEEKKGILTSCDQSTHVAQTLGMITVENSVGVFASV